MLLIFLLVLVGSTHLLESDDHLRVMTYNIHHGRAMDGELDLDQIARVILDANVSVVALQEVDIGVTRSEGRNLLSELAELTGLRHAVFGKNLDFQGGEYGNAILSAYPIAAYRNTHLRQLTSGEQRGVQEAVLDVNGTALVVLNTHLDHTQDDSERLYSIRQLIDEILPLHATDCLILAGDINDIPGSNAYAKIKGELADAWSAAGEGPGFTFPADIPERRIDYIFHGPQLEPISAEVPSTEASDHRPLVVEFRGCS